MIEFLFMTKQAYTKKDTMRGEQIIYIFGYKNQHKEEEFDIFSNRNSDKKLLEYILITFSKLLNLKNIS